jgi:hypothetical protein
MSNCGSLWSEGIGAALHMLFVLCVLRLHGAQGRLMPAIFQYACCVCFVMKLHGAQGRLMPAIFQYACEGTVAAGELISALRYAVPVQANSWCVIGYFTSTALKYRFPTQSTVLKYSGTSHLLVCCDIFKVLGGLFLDPGTVLTLPLYPSCSCHLVLTLSLLLSLVPFVLTPALSCPHSLPLLSPSFSLFLL